MVTVVPLNTVPTSLANAPSGMMCSDTHVLTTLTSALALRGGPTPPYGGPAELP
jgi:hypothetical protein